MSWKNQYCHLCAEGRGFGMLYTEHLDESGLMPGPHCTAPTADAEIARLNALVVELGDVVDRKHTDAMIAHRFIETLVGEQARGRDFAVKVPMAEQQIASLTEQRDKASADAQAKVLAAFDARDSAESALQEALKFAKDLSDKYHYDYKRGDKRGDSYTEGKSDAADEIAIKIAALATQPTVEAQERKI